MKRFLSQFWSSETGAGAAEFALVLPLLLVLLFGIIDGGRYLWEVNRVEKATQIGARVAAVTTPVSSDLINAHYAGQTIAGKTISPGALIPAAALDQFVCTETACTCNPSGGSCPTQNGSVDTTTFNDVIVARMQDIMPEIEPGNVTVTYSGSGFGFASSISGTGGGSAGGSGENMEISPLITVSVTGLMFRPITTLLLANISLPVTSTSLTAEDASGSYSE